MKLRVSNSKCYNCNLMKTFILGVGAQKSGTTWVHQYLSSHYPYVDMGAFKEYHVWDALCGIRPEYKVVDTHTYKDVMRKRMQQDESNYFDYFANILSSNSTLISGDISPDYAALPKIVLKKIKAGFQERSITTKVLFIMRDPVERTISAYKDIILRNDIGDVDHNINIVDFAKSDLATKIGRYENTIFNVQSVFDKNDIYLELYENLFSKTGVYKLSQYFNMHADYDMIDEQVNSSQFSMEFEEVVKNTIALEYIETYKCAIQKFPEIENLWSSFKYIKEKI